MFSNRTLRIFARTLVATGLSLAGGLGVKAQDLSGWWISVDNVFPTLMKSDALWQMDELLIISPQGELENRILLFPTKYIDHEECAGQSATCSDAPLAARAKSTIDLESRTLRLAERSSDLARIEFDNVDMFIRKLAVTGTEAWRFELPPNGNLMLRASSPTWIITSVSGANINFSSVDHSEKPVSRTFARIDPERLKRLIAAYNDLSETRDDWRCFLANATAGDPGFSSIHRPDSKKPNGLDTYMKVASYVAALQAAHRMVTLDDPDKAKVELARKAREKTEVVMLEAFDDIVEPKSDVERKRYVVKELFISARDNPSLTEQAKKELLDKLTGGEPVSFAMSEDQIASFAAFRAKRAEIDRLFCRK